MAETRMVGREVQEEFLKTVRKGQEFVLEAIKTWAEAVQSITPKLPTVHLPLADKLPTPQDLAAKLPAPKDVVDSSYGFAEKVLASQRKFAEDVLKAAAPLAPGKSNGQAPKAGRTSK